jgi:hypothetical protein
MLRPAALVLVALLAGGCFDGDDDTSATAGTGASPAAFRAEAAAVCQKYAKQIATLATPGDLQALADAGDRALDLQQEELDELRMLSPPEADADDVEQMLTGLESAIATGHDLVDAARDGDQASVAEAVGTLRTQLEDVNRIARDLDLGACAITG